MRQVLRSRGGYWICVAALAAACSGGGGGGGGSGAGLQFSKTSVALSALAGDGSASTTSVQISWTGSNVAVVIVGVPPGDTLPPWLGVDLVGSASPLTLNIHRTGTPTAPGRYTATLRVVAGTANYDVLESKDLPVTLDVVAVPTLSPTSLNAGWVESERPANASITVTHDARVLVGGATVDVAWLSASVAGDVVNVAGTAAAETLTPGSYGATVSIPVSLDGRVRTLTVPVSATVQRALAGPAQLALEVNASTQDAALSGVTATVTTATQTALQLSAQTDVPWLVASNVVTGVAGNLSLSVPKSQLALLAGGVHAGTITLTPTAPNVQALRIPVTLTVRLPEVHFVAPVAFSDTVATDYVIVRGVGLADPAATLSIGGVPVVGAIVVSDTEVRVVPGARAAGDYVVGSPNLLGLARETAKLRVVAPPSYANASLAASLGLQDRVVPMSAPGIVFTVLSLNGSVISGGTPSTVQKFALQPDGTWTRTQYSYTDLADIAFTPDETQLVVLTKADLRLVDPLTMATTATITLPRPISGASRQLAVTSDGLVLIQELQQAYSLHDQRFVAIAGLQFSVGLGGSRDGSRAFFGDATNAGNVAYRYYDASTGSVVLSNTFKHYARGVYSRHAERAMANGYLCDGNLSFLGDLSAYGVTSHVGDLSPDGMRAYGFTSKIGFNNGWSYVAVVNVSNPSLFTELTPVTFGANYGSGRMAVEPRGRFAFIAAQSTFLAVDVR